MTLIGQQWMMQLKPSKSQFLISYRIGAYAYYCILPSYGPYFRTTAYGLTHPIIALSMITLPIGTLFSVKVLLSTVLG